MPNNCNPQYIFIHLYYKEINLIIGIRKVCRCQKGYRKSYIEETQAMQWPSEKGQNDKQWSTKNYKEN